MDGERPTKKPRTEAPGESGNAEDKSKQARPWRTQQIEFKRQQRRANLDHPQPESREHRRDRELFGIDDDLEEETSLKLLEDEEKEKLKKRHMPKMFSQPSVLSTADKGIFVTCDKGREKKSLTELADLVEDYIEKHDLMPAELLDPTTMLETRLDRQQSKSGTIPVDNEDSPVEEEEIDIESSIKAELSKHQKSSVANVKAFQLITLDVPCVSFLRFVPTGLVYDKIDVVDLVHTICANAEKKQGRIRSRYIKRLVPVTWLGKVLSGGLEKACEEVLPAHFKIESQGGEKEGTVKNDENAAEIHHGRVTFAVRANIRNNDKISRSESIDKIAAEVQRLGENKHKVDLKGYQKGIIVEIYRGWIGMCVVDNTNSADSSREGETSTSSDRNGYEALKRFNLAEIYAEGYKEKDTTA